MGMNLTQTLIASRLVEGEMKPGNDITIRVDQTLIHDAAGKNFKIQVLEQNPPREVIFWNIKTKDPKDTKRVPNPSNEPVRRNIIQLKAKDAYGEVEHFKPMMTTIAKYLPEDLILLTAG